MNESAKGTAGAGFGRFRRLGALAVLLAGLAGYAGTGFLLDDCLHLEQLAAAPGPANLEYGIDLDRLDLHLAAGPDAVAIRYFRPLTSLSLRIDHRLFGLRPGLFHLTNLMLHLVNAWLVLVLMRRLGLAPTAALAAALMWGVSFPAGLAAGWISGRSEVLAALCVLAAVIAAIRHLETRSAVWLTTASLLLALAVLAKETGLAGPVLVMIAAGAVRGRRPADANSAGRAALPVAMVGLLIVLPALRLWLGGLPQVPPPYAQPPISPAALGAAALKLEAYLIGALTGLPVLPLVQVEFLRDHWPAALVSAAALAGLGAALARRIPASESWRPAAWFLVAIAPSLWVMAVSLYLYLPLIGIAWLGGIAWQRSALARGWLVWLVVAGFAANAAFAACMVHMGRRAASAQADFEAVLASGRVQDVVLVDAPFWAYALPSRARLDDPSLSFRTHIVNFSPYLQPAGGSSVRWREPLACEISSLRGRYFASPLERFFLFGHEPCGEPRETAAFTMTCVGGSRPSTIELMFGPPLAEAGVAVLQFDRWRVRRLNPP